MSAPGGVSVVLPVSRVDERGDASVRSVLEQTLRPEEVLIVLNGSDDATRAWAAGWCARYGCVRVVEVKRAGLSGALNAGLRAARCELVARMDADDVSLVERFERQSAHLRENPDIAAVGCWYERVNADGANVRVCPPTDPLDLRWRLLLGNRFAHGSMMLRRSVVLEAGGYDPSLDRAQDYDLWVRLSRASRLANIPEVLYRYSARGEGGSGTSGDELQARIACGVMMRAWMALPEGSGEGFVGDAACALASGAGDGGRTLERIERRLRDEGPSRAGLMAWMWTSRAMGACARGAVEAGRMSRVREVGDEMKLRGVERLWLWGAGEHTRWLLAHARAWLPEVAGVVDDAREGERVMGFMVRGSEGLGNGEVALLSSDWHEDDLWRASTPARGRGVDVWRLYTPALAPCEGGVGGVAL